MEEVPTHVKKEPLEAWILRAFTGSETDDDLMLCARSLSHTAYLGVVAYPCIAASVDDGCSGRPLASLGAIWCTSFHCSQLPTHTLVTYRDQLDFMPSDQEVDDMASRVIQEPHSSPSQIASFAKKVQTIIRRHFQCNRHVAVPGSPYQTKVLVELRRALVDCLVAGGHADSGRRRDMGEGSGGRGLGDLGLGLTPPTQSHPPTSYAPLPPSLGFPSFQSPHPLGIGSSSFQVPLIPRIGSPSFQAPLPPYTVGLYTQHMPISTAFSSDSDEHDDEPTDVVTPTQQLGFGHLTIMTPNMAMWAELTSHNNDTRRGHIAYGAYRPYFTGVVQKAWTVPTNRMISHAQLVRKILKYQDIDSNLWSVRMTMRVPFFFKRASYVSLYFIQHE
ncbi:hypothetical protein M9H77_03836 [Catharanthus roseus]|uniref:Uncharacterized protein n=1 Tax=Catharanthus roseus TaxID=4058 RepID=A0ACC0CCS4_CATRO|nr:hypothetical protein M9H77_03836 [Catharanthus roseus]